MHCRFEDRLTGRALRLDGFLARIEARAAAEVGPALAAIDAARQR
ncbi:aminodeoxychorismate synthase component 1, partial [Achromobacter xylosoxidans]